jgi:hypothetical protein
VHVLVPQYFTELIGGVAAAAYVCVQLLFWLTVNSSLAASAHFEAPRRGYGRAASFSWQRHSKKPAGLHVSRG